MRPRTSGFRPRRRFGQNFLVDPGAIERIVAAFRPAPDDRVLEIGPGRGALTRRLAGRVAALIAVEIDVDLVALLQDALARDRLSGDVTLIQGDILSIDLPRLLAGLGAGGSRRARVVGNLPFNIATEAILRLLRERQLVSDLLVMVQREVAARILSPPGRKSYGGLSILCQAQARVESLLRLRPGSFRPRPKVDAEVIGLTLRGTDERPTAPEVDDLSRLLRTAFEQRRKTLLNNLVHLPPGSTETGGAAGVSRHARAEDLIRRAGLDPAARPETIPVEGFLALLAVWRGEAPRAARRPTGTIMPP